MARYAATGTRTDGGAVLGLLFTENGATAARGKLYEAIMGSNTSPGADNTFLYEFSQATGGVAAGTAVTPEPLDTSDKAAETATLKIMTTNPTTINGEPVLQIPLNQRATFRWVAAPGGELVWPATASSGILIQHTVASSAATSVTVHFEE